MNKKGQLSPALLELLGSAGLDTSELIWSVTSDMDDEGCYCTAWITFDKKGLYIAFGSEETVPGRQGKKATTKYTLRQLRSFPADEVGKLKTESYLTTARLIGEKDGNEVAYTDYSGISVGWIWALQKAHATATSSAATTSTTSAWGFFRIWRPSTCSASRAAR